jgi:hypothetical protein
MVKDESIGNFLNSSFERYGIIHLSRKRFIFMVSTILNLNTLRRSLLLLIFNNERCVIRWIFGDEIVDILLSSIFFTCWFCFCNDDVGGDSAGSDAISIWRGTA